MYRPMLPSFTHASYPRASEKFVNTRLLDLNELSALLVRAPETIRKDLKRNPHAVPPRLHLPGTRLLRWSPADVDRWLTECRRTAP